MKSLIIYILLVTQFVFAGDYPAYADGEAKKHIKQVNSKINDILNKKVGVASESANFIAAKLLGDNLYELSDYKKQLIKLEGDQGYMMVYRHKVNCFDGGFFCVHVSKNTKTRKLLIVKPSLQNKAAHTNPLPRTNPKSE